MIKHLLIVLPLILTGCVGIIGGRISSSDAWTQHHGSAGKVLLVISNSSGKWTNRHMPEINRATIEALNHQPNTQVINTADLPDHGSADVGDTQAIALGKSRGADSVCVINLVDYSGYFAIGVWPPGWSTVQRTMFSLRMVDVQSGELLTHFDSSRSDGGLLAILPPSNLQRNYQQQLARALATPQR